MKILGLVSATLFFAQANLYAGGIVQQNCSINDTKIVDSLTEELQSFFKDKTYDRSVYFLATQLKPGSQECEKEKFDSKALVAKFGGANCVGVAASFQERVESTLRFQILKSAVPNYLRQPGLPEYTHAALVAGCKDGYILVDPGFNLISGPILIKDDQSSTELELGGRGRWSFHLDKSKNRIVVEVVSLPEKSSLKNLKKEDRDFLYELEEWKNPDLEISSIFFKNDKKVLIYGFSFPNQPWPHLVLNFSNPKKMQIEYSILLPEDGSIERRFTFPFSKYYEESDSIDRVITEEIAASLHLSKSDLLLRLKSVMDRVK